MSRSVALACLSGVVGMLGACADPNITPVSFDVGAVKGAAAVGPNLRLVTERPREIPGKGPLPTICSDPAPDVAIAFSRSFATSVNATIGGETGKGELSADQKEVASELAGRSAGVLALRDGLSAACQAYANGVIGQSAYALILSQYGNLLVALAGTGAKNSAPPRHSARDTALSALLVSCISEHDPTRLGAGQPSPLLSKRRCEQLIAIAAGRGMRG